MLIGEVLTRDDVHMISPGNGYKWEDLPQLIGRVFKNTTQENTIIKDELFN